jgi:LysM repeat protein
MAGNWKWAILLALLLSACTLSAQTVSDAATGVSAALPTLGAAPATATPFPTAQASVPSAVPLPASGGVPTAQLPAPIAGCTPRADWSYPYVIVRGDTLFSIARRAGSSVNDIAAGNCLADPTKISAGQTLRLPRQIPSPPPTASGSRLVLYYIVGDSGGTDAVPVGCDTYLIPARTEGPATPDAAGDIRASLNRLLNATSTQVGQSGLVNYWGGQGLSLTSVGVSGSRADITISGNVSLSGVCSDAAIEAQILLSVFSVPGIDRAFIIIGGRNMKQLFDASGLVGPDALYTLADIKTR